jgi:hypothetical protein
VIEDLLEAGDGFGAVAWGDVFGAVEARLVVPAGIPGLAIFAGDPGVPDKTGTALGHGVAATAEPVRFHKVVRLPGWPRLMEWTMENGPNETQR